MLHATDFCTAYCQRFFRDMHMASSLPWHADLIGVSVKEVWSCCRQGTRRGYNNVLHLHEMLQNRNGSSQMDFNPVTSRILIKEPHTERSKHREAASVKPLHI